MVSRKRQRDEDDVDGGEVEVEVESASSSFRMNNQHTKRSRVAMAQAAGGSVVSDDDDDDFERDFLMSDANEDDAVNDLNDNRNTGSDSDSDELDYTIRQDSEDDENEEDDIDEIRATQFVEKQLRKHKENWAAESGVIEEVQMINFMCHANLKIELGPLINFIIGHNGSGKSAILTALQICLGNKATSTNRSKSLKGMVKSGTEQARVLVKIANRGENAYKPDEYGESIIVERHFSASGSSGFKLKSAEGRIITLKKTVLEEILDFFGLQMDNPINVLTQDKSRQFLSDSTPAEKYKFFIQGTQLETLDHNYKIMEEQVDSTEMKLQTRDEDGHTYKRRVEQAERIKKEADAMERLEQRMNSISRQHAWAQVEEQEQALEVCKGNVTIAQNRVAEYEEKFEEVNARHEAQNEAVQAAQRGMDTMQEALAPVQEQYDTAKKEFDDNTDELRKHVSNHRLLKEDVKHANKEVGRLTDEIKAERERLAGVEGDAHVKRLADLEELKQKYADAKEMFDNHGQDFPALVQASNDALKRFQDARKPVDDARTKLDSAKAQLNRFKQDKGQKWAPYPDKMANLCREIDRESRWKTKPVGPLGMYISLLKPEWGSIIERTCGNVLNSFAVTSKYDHDLLNSIMKRINIPQSTIIIGNDTPLDTTGKEPPEDVDTILRVLKFDSEIARNTLIINQAAEQTVLFKARAAGFSFMYDGPRRQNVRATLTMAEERGAGNRWEFTKGGQQKSGPVHPWNNRLRLQVNHEQELQQLQARLREAQDAFGKAEDELRGFRQSSEKAKQAVEAHKREAGRLKVQMQAAEDEVEAMEAEIDANRPQDGKLQELDRQLDEAKQEKRLCDGNFTDLQTAKNRLDENAAELKQKLDDAQRELDAKQKLVDKAKAKLDRCQESRQTTLYELNAAEDDVRKAKEAVAKREQKFDEQQAFVANHTRQASEICARVVVEEGMDGPKLEALSLRLQKDYQQAQARQGTTREQATAELKKAQFDLESFTKETQGMREVAKVSHEGMLSTQTRG